MSASAKQAVALLQERRSALISAAVTGQIDVRGLVAEASAA
jgi:type I restriction enzyme S subunit